MTTKVHRLKEMRVEEVSLVDRAANKRRFLIVKKDTMALGLEIKTAADGTLTTAEPASKPKVPTAEPKEAATGPATSLTADAKTAIEETLSTALEALAMVQAAVEGATVVESEGEQSAGDVCDILLTVAENFEDLCTAMLGLDEEEKLEEDEPLGDESVAPGKPPTPSDEEPLAKRLEVRRAKRVIAHSEISKASRSLVQKLGAKMARGRYEKLQAAMKMLAGVVKELSPALKQLADSAEAPAPAKGKAKPKAPPPTVPESPVAKRLDDVCAVVKRLETDITTMRANVAQSNSTQAGVRVVKAAPCSWPVDLNSGIASPSDDTYLG